LIEGEDLVLFERSLEHATSKHTGGALDTALAGLGWQEALFDDPHTAVSLLFTFQGLANATSSALDQVIAWAMDRPATAVALPVVGRWSPPGTLHDDVLCVHGVCTAALREVATVLVVAACEDTHVMFEVSAASLKWRQVGGLDPSLGLVEVEGRIDGATGASPADWSRAMSMGQLALAHELLGASRRMLQLARQHALERVQFGRPVAMFQAVRHRLADTLIALEAAGSMIEAAWLEHSPQSASMAKATAGRGALLAARHCQQVLAGMGFTTEHPLHRYIRRVLVQDQLLGSTRWLTRALGEHILEHRQLPALLPL
jgi:Acyl-CoA dehydrogenase, C-terminal domain